MIAIETAFDWLTVFSWSHLSPGTRSFVNLLEDPATAEDIFDVALRDLLKTSQASRDGFEYPEALLTAGKAAFNRKRLAQARDLTRQAAELYIKDDEHYAVACWMLGVIEQACQDYHAAYSNWLETRKIFTRMRDNAFRIRDENEFARRYRFFQGGWQELLRWFPDRLLDINVHLAQTIYEPFTWLNRHRMEGERAKLPPFLPDFKHAILEEIKNGSASLALEMCAELVRQTEKLPQGVYLAEAEVIHGLVAFQARQLDQAQDCLRRAVGGYTPDSHPWAVALWMLGVAQLEDKATFSAGIQSWQRAIATFSNLREWADQKQQKLMTAWYAEILPVFDLALAEQLRKFG